jgi:flagellar basal-body rod protein FlgC
MDAVGTALSGLASSQARLFASAHNVANLNTESFRPLRALQSTLRGGGAEASLERSPAAREVSLAHETVERIRAGHQFVGSLRVLETALQMRGSLVDLLG